jgi:hypothetical protein
MALKRVGTDVLSVLSLLLVLVGLTILFDLADRPVAVWISGSMGDSPKELEQGRSMASQFLGLTFMGIALLAGYVGGRFVRGRPLKVRMLCLAGAFVVMALLWIVGNGPGVIMPTLMTGRLFLTVPFLIVLVSAGWAYGTKSVGSISNSTWAAGSAGTSAGDAGVYVSKHHDDISDIFS